MTNNSLTNYLLRIGDSSLILGQRMAEWCSNGPFLEEDIAMTNISLDFFGQARSIYSHIAEIDNTGKSEDDYAFGRNERKFYNALITEIPNGHFGDTVTRNFLFDAFNFHFYTELSKSSNEFLKGFAIKSLKEVNYHLRHSGEWIVRLGDGTEESKAKIQQSLIDVWDYTADMFATNDEINELTKEGIAPDYNLIKENWKKTVSSVIKRAKLTLPEDGYMQKGSLDGIHSEFLGRMLGEMQYLHNAHPGAKW